MLSLAIRLDFYNILDPGAPVCAVLDNKGTRNILGELEVKGNHVVSNGNLIGIRFIDGEALSRKILLTSD